MTIKGVELTTGGGSSAVSPSAVDAEIHAQSDVEDFLSAKAEEILGRIFPPGAATVSVNVKLMRNHVSSSRDEVLTERPGIWRGIPHPLRQPSGRNRRHGFLMGRAERPRHPKNRKPCRRLQFDVEYRIGHLIEQTEAGPGGIERVSVGIVIPDPSTQGFDHRCCKGSCCRRNRSRPSARRSHCVYPVASLSKASGQGVLPGTASPLSESGHAALGDHPKPIWALLLGVALLFGSYRHLARTSATRRADERIGTAGAPQSSESVAAAVSAPFTISSRRRIASA